jgi:hypothetical protein
MKISVAGRDRTEDLGPGLRRQAEAMTRLDPRRQPARIPEEIGALALARAKSDAEYLEQFARLVRYRDAVDTFDYNIPRKPGLTGFLMGRLKGFLWKLLRYQHDRIAFRQNMINGLYTSGLEFEIVARRKEIAELEQRVAELEKQMVSYGFRQQPDLSRGFAPEPAAIPRNTG